MASTSTSTAEYTHLPFFPSTLSSSLYSDLVKQTASIPHPLRVNGDSNLSTSTIATAIKDDDGNDMQEGASDNPFFAAMRKKDPKLMVHQKTENADEGTKNLMLTENSGVTNRETGYPPLDLFNSLSRPFKPSDLLPLLQSSWSTNAQETLQIIYNARSIPSGKGESETFVRSLAWMRDEGRWLTVVGNLGEIVRPVVIRKTGKDRKREREEKEKKEKGEREGEEMDVEKEEGDDRKKGGKKLEDEDMEVLDESGEKTTEEELALTPGTARSHGYYKDLLNILVLASVDQFHLDGDYAIVPGYDAADFLSKMEYGRVRIVPASSSSNRSGRGAGGKGMSYKRAREMMDSAEDERALIANGEEGRDEVREKRKLRKNQSRQDKEKHILNNKNKKVKVENRVKSENPGLTKGSEEYGEAIEKMRKLRLEDDIKRGKEIKEENRKRTKKARDTLREKVVRKMGVGPKGEEEVDGFYRLLHVTIARVFGKALKRDLEYLEKAKVIRESQEGTVQERNDKAEILERNISLAAKWAPTEKGFHDYYTMIADSIALYLFPPPTNDSTTPVTCSGNHLTYARTNYRTRFITPLRNHIDILERHLSANEFNFNYARVPSLAMKKNKSLFIEKDPERFEEYLMNVARGKASISGGVLLPGQLVRDVRDCKREQEIERRVCDLQWKSLVQSILDNGTLSDCLAVCDVSGSMYGPILSDKSVPVDHSVGISLLISEVSKAPFKGAILTFSARPCFIDVNLDQPLWDKVKEVERETGYNTDLIASFRLILSRAKEANLKQEDMVKKVIVLSDMEFDQATTGKDYRTHFQIIDGEFKAAGYQTPMMVFWNLAGMRTGPNTSKAVTAEIPNTALLSGYSASMVKVLLDKGEISQEEEEEEEWEEVVEEDGEVTSKKVEKKKPVDPITIMRKAIDGKEFEKLKVYD